MGAWLSREAYAYGYPSMRLDHIGSHTIPAEHPLKKTPKMRGHVMESYLPNVTLVRLPRVECWASAGRELGESWARVGRKLGESWARVGRKLGESWRWCFR
eukprot:447330-Prorocentrum_minimum.AAC.1